MYTNNKSGQFLPSFGNGRIKGFSKKEFQENVGFFKTEENLSECVKNLHALHNFKDTYLEIGFGAGESLIARSQHNLAALHIGCEVFMAGLLRAKKSVCELNSQNIVLVNCDGRNALQALGNESLSGIFLLFPDPWPKKKHHKRRVVSQEFLKLCYDKLRNDGFLIIASDNASYQEWITYHVSHFDGFVLELNETAGFYLKPAELLEVVSRYEQKALKQNASLLFFKLLKVAATS